MTQYCRMRQKLYVNIKASIPSIWGASLGNTNYIGQVKVCSSVRLTETGLCGLHSCLWS